jgi:enterochelin esterase family protein
MTGPSGGWCGTDALTFRLSDPERHLAGVRLVQHIGLPPDRLDFAYDEGDRAWRLSLPRPAAWRVEYLLERRLADGSTERSCDPDNPRRVGGAFGDKSVVECPDYTEPAWLAAPAAEGAWRDLAVPVLGQEMGLRIWSPSVGTDRVVIVHDGPEYDVFASLGRYSASMIMAGRVPPYHLVLLGPGDRNEWYSANPSYTKALAGAVLPAVAQACGTQRPVVGVGTSLGGLAMLHAQRRHPRLFAGLFLQSASFFRPHHDSQESSFKRYKRIVRFTDDVSRASRTRTAVPTTLTCGRVEENLGNNREMALHLRRQGYPVELYEVPDAHNFTGWRDALDPHLTDLLRRVWPA